MHHRFADLPALLRPGDLLVFNDARVIPARFGLRKSTGGRMEATFLAEPRVGQWRVLLKDAGHASVGTNLEFESDPTLSSQILESHGGGEFLLAISPPGSAQDILERLGRMPLPPYIRRNKRGDPRDSLDRQRYQTIYARAPAPSPPRPRGCTSHPSFCNASKPAGSSAPC